MQCKYTYTRLLVSDFKACFQFYNEVMGFHPVFGDENGSYADFGTGDVSLALFDKQEMSQAVGTANLPASRTGQDALCLVFEVVSVDAAYEEFRAKGVEFDAGPTSHPEWGIRTAHLRDPEGNLIEINEPLS